MQTLSQHPKCLTPSLDEDAARPLPTAPAAPSWRLRQPHLTVSWVLYHHTSWNQSRDKETKRRGFRKLLFFGCLPCDLHPHTPIHHKCLLRRGRGHLPVLAATSSSLPTRGLLPSASSRHGCVCVCASILFWMDLSTCLSSDTLSSSLVLHHLLALPGWMDPVPCELDVFAKAAAVPVRSRLTGVPLTAL